MAEAEARYQHQVDQYKEEVGALKHQLDIQRQQVNGIPIFVEKEWNIIMYQMLNRVLKPPSLFQQQVNGISNFVE